MNSAERLHTYAQNLPKEAPYVITENTPPPNCPTGILNLIMLH